MKVCQHRVSRSGICDRRIHPLIGFQVSPPRLIFGLFCLSAMTFGANLTSVKTVYIETLGTKPGAPELSRSLAAELKRTAGLRLVSSKDQADAFIQGDAEIWTRGYISLNPRSGTDPHKGQRIYGGLLSVELRGRDNSVLWSSLATPRSGTGDVEKDLSHQVAKRLKTAIDKEKHP